MIIQRETIINHPQGYFRISEPRCHLEGDITVIIVESVEHVELCPKTRDRRWENFCRSRDSWNFQDYLPVLRCLGPWTANTAPQNATSENIWDRHISYIYIYKTYMRHRWDIYETYMRHMCTHMTTNMSSSKTLRRPISLVQLGSALQIALQEVKIQALVWLSLGLRSLRMTFWKWFATFNGLV
jgi:hypothetical protein